MCEENRRNVSAISDVANVAVARINTRINIDLHLNCENS